MNCFSISKGPVWRDSAIAALPEADASVTGKARCNEPSYPAYFGRHSALQQGALRATHD